MSDQMSRNEGEISLMHQKPVEVEDWPAAQYEQASEVVAPATCRSQAQLLSRVMYTRVQPMKSLLQLLTAAYVDSREQRMRAEGKRLSC